MISSDEKLPAEQGNYEVGKNKPPKNRQFGQPGGNRRNNGCWKKEDTARYKLEQMLKLSEDEIEKIANDKEAPLFERRIAKSLLKENEWKITESMINQVYGQPKQQVETMDITPPPLSPRKQKKSKE